MKSKDFFSAEQQQQIIEAIGEAELNTSGEIRVHIDTKCKTKNPLDRAVQMFKKLEMHKTDMHNGVLIYLSVSDRKFAIIGDEGIDQKVPHDFWDNTKNLMIDHFKKGEMALGLTEGIKLAGLQLKEFFPYQTTDVDELPNKISFG
ncbi:MAG TPA: TPM domain-containing protein [Salinivirgaceae bacterium]|nr:TPM domain-containing protein [Salinivirgaceae bacterium]